MLLVLGLVAFLAAIACLGVVALDHRLTRSKGAVLVASYIGFVGILVADATGAITADPAWAVALGLPALVLTLADAGATTRAAGSTDHPLCPTPAGRARDSADLGVGVHRCTRLDVGFIGRRRRRDGLEGRVGEAPHA